MVDGMVMCELDAHAFTAALARSCHAIGHVTVRTVHCRVTSWIFIGMEQRHVRNKFDYC